MRGNKKNQTPLQIKRANQLLAEAKLQRALATAQQARRAADCGPTKRRTNEFLARYIGLPLNCGHAIRSEEQYHARSYNRARQVTGLIDHLFVRYPVPHFLYRSLLTFEGLDLVFDDKYKDRPKWMTEPPEVKYRNWFMVVAQGGSFAKASCTTFTKKEAHWFLQAPSHNRIDQNIFWARAAAAGIPRSGCDYLVSRLDARFLRILGARLPDLLRFYANEWFCMRANDKDEITDYIRAAANDREFSFKGRTFGSMRKLSHAWHRMVYSGVVREYRSWSAALRPWEWRRKGTLVRAIELTNNRALAEEGKKQYHCVYSYTSQCIQGVSTIVSLRWYATALDEIEPPLELQRLTLEVRRGQREIVQIRGRQNRQPSVEQMETVRLWAGVQGFTISSWAYW